jgi:ABC-type glutathione transport system ATPase component
MFRLNRENGTTLVVVTHDEAIAARCERRLSLAAGRLVADLHSDRVPAAPASAAPASAAPASAAPASAAARAIVPAVSPSRARAR